MAEWIEPVIDRTSADVERLITLLEIGWEHMTTEERYEFSKDIKGALNRSDLERIKNNVTVIGDLLLLELINPNIPEIPTYTYYRELLQDITMIRNTHFYRQDTPQVPTGQLNTYDKWNDIEKILLDAYELILLTITSYSYTGQELYAGDIIPVL